ncbi:MAG: CDP-glycerol glycerophosphotransferase family protein [Candidatus Cloacimonadaceae bacterium]
MVASYYLLKPFYSLAWRLLNLFCKRRETVFYCHSTVDMQNWLPIQKYLIPLRIVSDKAHTRKALRQMGYRVSPLPAFPKAVIMCRVASHKFPSRKVIKIGMTHGAYHFKRIGSASHYKPFSLYLYTSPKDLANAQARGISCGKVGGYPKLDPYLNQTKSSSPANAKKRIVFTATYDSSGMSGIHLWLDKLPELTGKYDIYVSLHPWMNTDIVKRITAMPNVTYLKDMPLQAIWEADACIVDSSSIIGECCAFDKPMISWKIPPTPRSVPEIEALLPTISLRISTFDELPAAIERALSNPEEQRAGRAAANAIFFDRLDGKAGERSAQKILKLLPELKP